MMSCRQNRQTLGQARTLYRQAFTIIELLVVIVVIAILAAVTMVTYRGIQNRAGDVVTAINIRNYLNVFDIYQLDYQAYPGPKSCLGKKPAGQDVCSGYLYEGDGCSALGVEPGSLVGSVGWDDAFDDDIAPYMNQPETVQVFSQKTFIAEEGGCTASQLISSPSYQVAKSITLYRGSGMFATHSPCESSGCSKQDRQAFMLTYAVASNGECHNYPGKQVVHASGSVADLCFLADGDVTIVDD